MITVAIGKRRYRCNQERAADLLSKASKRVRQGVYAIEDLGSGFIQIVDIPMSVTQIKRMRREYKRRGARIYANY